MTDTLRLEAEIAVDHSGWDDPQALVRQCFDSVMNLEVKGTRAGVISLMFSGDAKLRELNKSFRNIDKPTNVLSFPGGPPDLGLPDEAHAFIGDIALAYETCFREAEERNIPLHDHLAHLILHGVLHLFGYDHETDAEAEVMERLETELLADLGIADPYSPMERP